MCSVGGSKCIVYIDIAIGGKRLCELWVIGLFLWVEPAVLKKKDFTWFEGLDFLLHFVPYYIRCDLDRSSKKLFELLSNRNHGEVRVLLSLWPSKVAHDDKGSTWLLKYVVYSRKCSKDSGCICNLAILDRHVEINSDQNPLVLEVCISDCIQDHNSSLYLYQKTAHHASKRFRPA